MDFKNNYGCSKKDELKIVYNYCHTQINCSTRNMLIVII